MANLKKEGKELKTQTVVKIDLCKSKLFNQAREAATPDIRKIALRKLLDISTARFPRSDEKYPNGSFYKADGDAVFFILDKPTVAIRSAIEFMKQWYHDGLKQEFPESRVLIHRGEIDSTTAPGGTEIVGKVFEDIAVIEKTLDDGKIFVSEDVKKNSDITITKFVHFGTRKDAQNRSLSIFYLAFSDPRTFQDDAWAHTLFIAHKESAEIRKRIFRFFLVEYLLENKQLSVLAEFEAWAKSKDYSVLPRKEIESLLADQSLFVKDPTDGITTYKLKQEKIHDLKRTQDSYQASVDRDIKAISEEIEKETNVKGATKGFDIKKIAEEYLCGVFSEIRMIANYFRHTLHLHDSDGSTYKRYDYILDRHLENLKEPLATQWKNGFVLGLKKISDRNSLLISAIFHNILAGYYLNRSFHASPYQLEKIRKRRIFVDTNILYALRCEVSSFHERVRYFADRLNMIGVSLKIYPFSIAEFEASLEKVEIFHRRNPNSPYLTNWNPWLYQEFRSNPHKYINDIGVCRHHYSVAKGRPIEEENYPTINTELKTNNLRIEPKYETYSEEEKRAIWDELKSSILTRAWDVEEYFASLDKLTRQQESVIEHDVNMLENVKTHHKQQGNDDLGPKVMLITTDSKLIRCRKDYPFVITTEQFLEFMMPYLFLSDIPAEDPNKFPNKLLSAQLGIHISYWEPSVLDVIKGFFAHPDCLEQDTLYAAQACSFSSILNRQRLAEIIEGSRDLPPNEKEQLASQVAETVQDQMREKNEVALAKSQVEILKQKLEKEKQEKEKHRARAQKLQRTVKYWKRVKKN